MTNSEDKIIVDLDNTLTIEDSSKDYSEKELNSLVAKSIKNAKKLGYSSKIFSSRNMKTFQDDLIKIEEVTRPIAQEWLKKNQIIYDELILGKPWCGNNGWYLDDKNILIEEFIFKFSGPYWNYNMNIIVPFYNEEENIKNFHKEQKKIERLFNVSKYIYIDNGSLDNTLNELNKIASLDEKIEVVAVKKNLGYGFGIKQGLSVVNSDIILFNHADLQFDAYSFFLHNLSALLSLKKPLNIMPQRYNRSNLDSISSLILRSILSMIFFKKVFDFNGQPKLIFFKSIDDLRSLPDNFCFDLAIYNIFEKQSVFLPILQKERSEGESSWSKDVSKRFRIFLDYIFYALKN